MTEHRAERKILTAEREQSRVALLFPALQRGVLVKARLGESIRSLLCKQFGLDPDYVKNRIQTAFLDGKPVDDFDSAIVREGSVLTLSGAMPGLAGATLRKGGFFTPLRASLSYQNESGPRREREGLITIRVFNILLPELAPILLSYGILFPRQEFASLLREMTPKDRAEFMRNGKEEAAPFDSEIEENQKFPPADFIELRIGE